jgi:chromosome segregation ATPase
VHLAQIQEAFDAVRHPPMAEKLLEVLRRANDETERAVTKELERVMGAQSTHRRELEESRAKCAELQKDLERATQQKSYVTDAFENSRKEVSRLRAENEATQLDLSRLRKMVEELQAEKIADRVARQTVHADLEALELERDAYGRALGTATKQLFGRQMAAAAEAASPAPGKGRHASSAKKPARPAGKALGQSGSPAPSPRQTGGVPRRR